MTTNLKNEIDQLLLCDETSLAYQRLVIRVRLRHERPSLIGIILKLVKREPETENPNRLDKIENISLVPPGERSRQNVTRLGKVAMGTMFRRNWTVKRRYKSHGIDFIGGRYALH